MSTAPPKRKTSARGNETRSKLLVTTAELLQAQGYHATGLKQILTESGAPRGSLYFHFPGGKEDLAGAALRLSGQRWRAELRGVVDGAEDLASALRKVCNLLAASMEESDFRDGCPIATTTLEAAAHIESLHKICSEHFHEWTVYLSEQLAKEGVPEAKRSTLATLILSSLEGALLLSRAHRDTKPIFEVAGALLEILQLAGKAEAKETQG